MQNAASIAWYRQFWPWFLIALPATAVFACLYTIWLAVQSPNDMVVDDYYREGMAINRSLQQATLASQLQLTGELTIHPVDNSVTLQLQPPQALAELQLQLIDPLNQQQDIAVILGQQSDGSYRAQASIKRQRWYLQVSGSGEQGQWRLQGELDLSARNSTRVLP